MSTLPNWDGLPLPDDMPPEGSCVRIKRPEAGLVVLTLDPPHRSATVLDLPLWRDLALALATVQPSGGDRALVIRGREPLHFAFGADIEAIETLSDPELVRRMTIEVHGILENLENLSRSMCTVAAVGGPVPGGALELSLACRYVIAADSPKTRLGLPETKLGILPGWGGTHRLPKKIGVPAAMEAILTGRLYDTRKAAKLGIVDRVTKPEYLFRIAADLALGRTKARPKKRGLARWLVDKNPLATAIIENTALKQATAKTRGKYPAVELVVPMIASAARVNAREAATREADAISVLATGSVCKSLVSIFQASEAAKKLSRGPDGERAQRLERAVVVGAGVMGGAIASLMAEKGVSTRLADLSREALDKALVEHEREITKKLKRRRLEGSRARAALDHLDASQGISGVGRTQIAIEAVAETLPIKCAVLRELAEKMPKGAILATNTSSLSVTEIAAEVPDPGRVVGLHFFNPVRQMPLVEIVPGEQTRPEVVRAVAGLALALGKTPVIVKDVAGFLVNRLLGPFLDEALRLFEGGVAPQRLEDLLLDFGMPMGPLRLLDEVGFDIAGHAARSLHEAYGARMRPTEALLPWIEAGRVGRKSGKGFFDWSNPKKPTLAGDVTSLQTSQSLAELSDEEIVSRCVLSLVNEAARCLEEGVVTGPKELDLATVFGMGFAPFHGGVLHYADSVGAATLREQLDALAAASDITTRDGGRVKFQAANLIVELAQENGRFMDYVPASSNSA
jgi:3-hydroxyacyl-CoA dehydrogenase/enoyl-CoA hydratase/3-hydroxybutyryl-CoA epimerase